jgi:hypothetical protein
MIGSSRTELPFDDLNNIAQDARSGAVPALRASKKKARSRRA